MANVLPPVKNAPFALKKVQTAEFSSTHCHPVVVKIDRHSLSPDRAAHPSLIVTPPGRFGCSGGCVPFPPHASLNIVSLKWWPVVPELNPS